MLSSSPVDPDIYESLPPSNKVSVHMVAGAMAGILEHCALYPVDSVKTRMQSLSPSNPNAVYRNVLDALSHMVKNEGLGTPLRGMPAMVTGAGPAHALYFAAYEMGKSRLEPIFPSHVAYGLAGCGSTLLHDAVMTPAEVVKQRMQMFGSSFNSCSECAGHVLRTEGIAAFYRSFTTQLSINVPYQCLHFVIYESMQNRMNPKRQYSPLSHMISGGVAGALAAGVTTPLDVCKTLLNTQEPNVLALEKEYRVQGLMHAARTVYKLGGFKAYFQGFSARVLYQFPSTAICWSVYEFFKYAIIGHREDGDGDVLPGPVVEVKGEVSKNLPSEPYTYYICISDVF